MTLIEPLFLLTKKITLALVKPKLGEVHAKGFGNGFVGQLAVNSVYTFA